MEEYINPEIFNLDETTQEDELLPDIEETNKFDELCETL